MERYELLDHFCFIGALYCFASAHYIYNVQFHSDADVVNTRKPLHVSPNFAIEAILMLVIAKVSQHQYW